MKKIFFLFAFVAMVAVQAKAAFEVDGIYYYLYNSGACVTYAQDANGNQQMGYYTGDVVIPDTIEYNGSKYAVQYIGEKAFQGCPNMISLTIPATVKWVMGNITTFQRSSLTNLIIKDGDASLNIYSDTEYGDPFMFLSTSLKTIYQGRNVGYYYVDNQMPRTIFKNFTALDTIVFGAKVTAIHDSLYSGCTALRYIECKSITPPNSYNALTDLNYDNIQLMVPKNCTYNYQTAYYAWNRFTNITEPEYPKQLEYLSTIPFKGKMMYNVTTDMALQALANMAATNDSVQATFRHYQGNLNATVSYRHGEVVDMETTRLLASYPNSIWRVQQCVTYALSETDTAYVIEFAYNTDNWLSYYRNAITGYTLYVGYPYIPQEVTNPLGLEVAYTSSDESVAAIDEKTGVVNVLKDGVTTITATYKKSDEETLTADYTFTVEKGSYYDIAFIGEKMEERYGMDRIQLTKDNARDIFGDGKVSFDYETGVLTLNNYRRTFTDEETGMMGWSEWMYYSSLPQVPIAIEVIGDCRITNNSAGISSSAPLIIRGKGENAKLILDGYFPQLMGNILTIDNVEVHAIEHSPHPNVTCDTLTVTNNGYIEMYNTIADEAEGATEEEILSWGARAGQANDVILGEGIKILTTGVTLKETDSHWEEGVKTFYLNGVPALRVEIGPAPVVPTANNDNVSFGSIEIGDDPMGTVIDGVRYTFTTQDSVDVAEGCIVLKSTMTAEEVETLLAELVPGTAEFADKFHGLSFLLPAGKGEILLTAQTFGNHELNIKVGTNAAVSFSQTDKGEVKVAYDCAEPTMIYIYGTEVITPVEAAPRYVPIRFAKAEGEDDDTPASTGSIKIYSMKITGVITALENILGTRSSSPAQKVLRDGQIFILRDGKIYTPAGVEVK